MGTAEVALIAVQTLIASAGWKLDYPAWLERIGAEDDDYWKDKWFEWKQLVLDIDKFDAHTLAKIVVGE
jgi:hypothetical protein